MATFDIIVQAKENFQGYEGNPPSNETEYNAVKDAMFSETAPTWSELQTEIDAYVDPKASGNTKLLDLGLTQAEATALTGYTPPVAE
tara:strand:- start:83 stop:343 length:261 start_codon:yes stop_codon:yes gene_type:complete